jgi:plastocyanin
MTTDRLGTLPTIALALVVPLVALVTVLVTLNVTDDGTSAASGGDGAGGGATGTAVSIKNFQYSPDPIIVDAGAELTVTNDDGTVHTLTADDGSFDTGDLDGGAAGTITVQAPGRYAYHCDVHNYMTGTIEAR